MDEEAVQSIPVIENPVIPQFREKTMYIEYADPATGEIGRNSYSVQSSFKGILRLSPNSGGTLAETTTVQLSSADLTGKENIAFRDSIAHVIELPYAEEDDGGMTDGDGRQFIRVSESEGYMVDLRLGSDSIEANNLYIRGEMSVSNVIINANNPGSDIKNGYKHFLINDIGLPTYPDEDNYISRYVEEFVENPVVAPGITQLDEMAEIEAEVPTEFTEGVIGDKSAIVVTDGDNRLIYKNSTELIDELILEALLSMESVPTGSVHYFPLTIDQYRSLVGKQNKMYINGVESDPIIRDYLLCDGSRYYVKDFPELAKILHGTTITYDDCDDTNVYERKSTKDNDYFDSDEGAATFRVPDLRGQFIRSAYLNSKRDDDVLKDTVGGHRYSQLPSAAPDRTSSDPQSGDTHCHYSFYGSYEDRQYDTRIGVMPDTLLVQATDEYGSPINNSYVINANRSLKDYERVATLCGYSFTPTMHMTFPGVISANTRGYDGMENHMPTHHYITSPLEYDATKFDANGCSVDSGITSIEVNSVAVTTEEIEGYKNTSLNTYINGEGNSVVTSGLGYENHPIYIGVLPLIRI